MRKCLRTEHQFPDFPWFVLVGGMPFLVGIFAIANISLLWLSGYLVLMLIFGVVQIRFLCRHCPYYRQQPGKTVHCKAMWGPTKWFRPRPGALSSVDKAILFSFFLLTFLFPMYWLVLQPQLLVIYCLSTVIMVWTLARYECNRCMFFDCPFNRVSRNVKNDFLIESKDIT